MANAIGQDENQITGQVKVGIWLIRLTYVALAFSGALELVMSIGKPTEMTSYASMAIRLLGALIVFFAEGMVRNQKATQAALVTIITAISAMSIMCLLAPIGLGWFLGIILGLLLSLIAIQLMPSAWMGRGIFIAFFGGSFIALTDYFGRSVSYRINILNPQEALLCTLTVVLGVTLFLRFTSYPVTAKLILAMASLTTVMLNILGIVISSVTSSAAGITPETVLAVNLNFLLGSQISIVLSSLMGLFLARFITHPLTEIVEVVDRIARDGDLSQHATIYYRDEVGRMAEAFNHMMETLEAMAQNAGLMAQGDLTVRIQPRSQQDVLGNAFQSMAQNLRDLVGQISENSDQVNQASLNLADAAHLSGVAATQISQTMGQVAHGAIEQANVSTNTAGSVEQMRLTIEGVEQGIRFQSKAVTQAAALTDQIVIAIQQVSTDAKAGVARAEETVQEADRGARTIQQTILGMGTIQAKVEDSARKVGDMKQRSDQIGNILEVIEEIASQINLLALNAAIEAARAGEQGRGFAVVADEVRKLAEKSTAATKEIGSLIQSINSATSEAVASMNVGLNEVKSGMDRAGSAGEALEKIVGTVKGMKQQVSRIAESAVLVDSSASGLNDAMNQVRSIVDKNTSATQEMSGRSLEVARSVENIASISEENSASVEEVSASVDEMSAQVTTVNESAQMLTAMARNLEELVRQFKLDEPVHPEPIAPVPSRSMPTNGRKNGYSHAAVRPAKQYVN